MKNFKVDHTRTSAKWLIGGKDGTQATDEFGATVHRLQLVGGMQAPASLPMLGAGGMVSSGVGLPIKNSAAKTQQVEPRYSRISEASNGPTTGPRMHELKGKHHEPHQSRVG